MYPSMEKSTYLKAVAGGNWLGYEAAEGMPSFGTGAVQDLCRIVESGGAGGLAAAGALARIAQSGGSTEVIEAIQAVADENVKKYGLVD